MKVKIIVTKFVSTDAEQFKSVVQSLTGKDSVILADGFDGYEHKVGVSQEDDGIRRRREQPLQGNLVQERLFMDFMPSSIEELVDLVKK